VDPTAAQEGYIDLEAKLEGELIFNVLTAEIDETLERNP